MRKLVSSRVTKLKYGLTECCRRGIEELTSKTWIQSIRCNQSGAYDGLKLPR